MYRRALLEYKRDYLRSRRPVGSAPFSRDFIWESRSAPLSDFSWSEDLRDHAFIRIRYDDHEPFGEPLDLAEKLAKDLRDGTYIIDAFIQKFIVGDASEPRYIDSSTLSVLKSRGFTLEDLLNRVTDELKFLLHGSRVDISEGFLRPNASGKIYATDTASVAIMKAIISNRGLRYPGLYYDFLLDRKSPLEVEIYGMHENTIGERGFVYVIEDREGFENEPKGSWQYVKEGRSAVPYVAKIEVLKEDFDSRKHKIIDVDNKRRILW